MLADFDPFGFFPGHFFRDNTELVNFTIKRVGREAFLACACFIDFGGSVVFPRWCVVLFRVVFTTCAPDAALLSYCKDCLISQIVRC